MTDEQIATVALSLLTLASAGAALSLSALAVLTWRAARHELVIAWRVWRLNRKLAQLDTRRAQLD